MNTDELREVLIEQSVILVQARIAQYELNDAIAEMVEALPDVTDLAPDLQYGCFLEACKRSGVDPHHAAFSPMRKHYEAAIQHYLFEEARS